MQCPKCLGSMSKITVDDIIIDRCDTCGGLWFDSSERENLNAIPHVERTLDTGDPAVGRSMDQSRKADCPRCHAAMISMSVPRQPHIHFESCTICHGAFFDAGEFTDAKHLTVLERLKSFLQQIRK